MYKSLKRGSNKVLKEKNQMQSENIQVRVIQTASNGRKGNSKMLKEVRSIVNAEASKGKKTV
ncbi:hypothetical protein Pint_23280 [Pistacia integerrima]|uniref:Uncharacterized protein n=1 Tax=Pistacia integerrima TaxID=434235 RepID=A0ACC0YI37_9ROSI|nr:hypothetical protein Pint_23280 [Pistacia integerrima]